MTATRFDSISELIGYAQTVENRHEIRKNQQRQDHALWRLDEYVLDEIKHNSLIKKENYPAFTSNSPRTLSRVMSAMLNKNSVMLRFNIPPNTSEQEEETINKNERLVLGALYENDQVRLHRGDNDIQWVLTWYIAHRGGVYILPKWYPENKKNQWDIGVYDPLDCAHEKGDCCLDFFVRRYWDDKSEIETKWGVKGLPTNDENQVECLDIWWIDRDTDEEDGEIVKVNNDHIVYNAIVTAGGNIIKDMTPHPEFECNPVYCIRPGGNPSNTTVEMGSSHQSAMAEQWEGMYSGVRETIGWINRAMTLFGIYLRNGAIGPYVYKGRKNKNIAQSLKPFKVVNIDVNEEFGPASLPQMASEAKEFLTLIRAEWQKAGVSDIVFGDIPFTVSGFGMLQLRGAVEVLISSYIKATQNAYVIIAKELTSQFVKLGGRKKINVKGYDNRSKEFIDSIKPQEIQKEYIITATLNEGLPRDPVQIGSAATQWRQAGAPLHEIFEKVFEFEDSQAVAEQAKREQAEQLPPVMLTKMIKAFLDIEDYESAKILTALINSSSANNPNAGQQNPTNNQPRAQFQPPEVQGGNTEQGGNYPTQPTGRPPSGK